MELFELCMLVWAAALAVAGWRDSRTGGVPAWLCVTLLAGGAALAWTGGGDALIVALAGSLALALVAGLWLRTVGLADALIVPAVPLVTGVPGLLGLSIAGIVAVMHVLLREGELAPDDSSIRFVGYAALPAAPIAVFQALL